MAALFLVSARQCRWSGQYAVFALLVTGSPALADPPMGTAGGVPATVQPTVGKPAADQGLSFKPDAGIVFRSSDFSVTAWGYAERLINPGGPDRWRRVRQGAEVDLPRFASNGRRAAFVYGFDLVNSDFFRVASFRRGFENLFVALQDADDPGTFRILIGENTQLLSRDDNLSSGNLPTINRSLILEEHGSTNTFGTQCGIQVQKRLSDAITVQVSTQDGRGSLNTDTPRYTLGNGFAAKLIATPKIAPSGAHKLSLGLAVDYTRNITDRRFVLATAIALAPIGSVAATGDRFTIEGDAAYTFPVASHAATIEGEIMRSTYSASRTDVFGGYAMAQVAVFDARDTGDLDLFVRYDFVSVQQDGIPGRARQQALRTGVNCNLPFTGKLASLHLEYARNRIDGPAAIVTDTRPSDEFRIGLRVSLQRYLRH